MGFDEVLKPEKKWKLVYLRSEKLSTENQLGSEYPRRKIEELAYE